MKGHEKKLKSVRQEILISSTNAHFSTNLIMFKENLGGVNV